MVVGPPCGGKTTYVAEQRGADDLVVDLDAIATALGYPESQIEWDTRHPAAAAARMARAHVIRAVLDHRVAAPKVWIIEAVLAPPMRAQYIRAAASIVTVDPGIDICTERAASRPDGTIERIEAWYRDASPTVGVFRSH